MKRFGRTIGLATLGAFAQQSAAATPLVPTTKWVVNYDEAQCVASRNYGTTDKPLVLVFKAPANGTVLQLAVMRKAAATIDPDQLEGEVRYGDTSKQISVLTFTPEKSGRRLFLYNLPREEVARGTVGPLEVRAGSRLKETFGLSGVAPVMKALDECVADLRRYWNYSEEEQSPKLAERAKANLARLFSPDDYPGISVRGEQQGTVDVVLLINEQGKVADCTLVQGSGVAALDAQTCVIIRARAKYTPALGRDGKPAKDVATARIRWLMP